LAENAQLQLEALVCIALVFGLIAFALHAANSMHAIAMEGNELLLAEAMAQKCGLAADVLFSNGGGKLELSESCYGGKEHEVKGVFNGREKTAFSVAKNIVSTQAGSTTVMEVEVENHYR